MFCYKCCEIGKRQQGGKPPLLKITISIQEKKSIFCNKLHLRKEDNPQEIKKIFITPDLTPSKQKKNKKLRKELANLIKNGREYMTKTWNNSAERFSLTPSSCTDNHSSNSNYNKLAHNKSFKLLLTNFRGIRSKFESFINTLDEEAPHFIEGTKSWLNPSVLDNEIFPVSY